MSTSTGNNSNHVALDAPDIIKMEMLSFAPLFSVMAFVGVFGFGFYSTGLFMTTNAISTLVVGAVTLAVGALMIIVLSRVCNRRIGEKSAALTGRINAAMQSQGGVTLADPLTFGDRQRVAAVDASGGLSLWLVTSHAKKIELDKLDLVSA